MKVEDLQLEIEPTPAQLFAEKKSFSFGYEKEFGRTFFFDGETNSISILFSSDWIGALTKIQKRTVVIRKTQFGKTVTYMLWHKDITIKKIAPLHEQQLKKVTP